GDDTRIRWTALFESPFAHPAVMVRRDVLTRHGLNYDPAFRTTQDYELWARLLGACRGANLGRPLTRYRMHEESVTQTRAADQHNNRMAVGLRTVRAWL